MINESFNNPGIVPLVNESSIIILNKGANVDAINLVIVRGNGSLGQEFLAVIIKLYIYLIVGRSKVDNRAFVVIYLFLVKFISLVFFMVNLSYILSILSMKYLQSY